MDGKWSGDREQYSATYEHRGPELSDDELRDAIQQQIDADGRWPNGISPHSEYIGESFEGLPEAEYLEERSGREGALDEARQWYERWLTREPTQAITKMRDALGRYTSDPEKAVKVWTAWRDAAGRYAVTPEEWEAEAADRQQAIFDAEAEVYEAEEWLIMDGDGYGDFDIDVTPYAEGG